jgi:anti-anti-sigma factor
MVLEVATVVTGEVAEITLVGELRADTAPLFEEELKRVTPAKPRRLVLRVLGLTYMASIGVRMLLIARQKMGPGLDIYVIAPQEQVIDTMRRTGALPSVLVRDEYPAAE